MRYLLAAVVLICSAQFGHAQTLTDSTLVVDQIFSNNQLSTTGIAFMPSGDAFVIEKNTGRVRVLDGRSLGTNPVLDLDVATSSEQGLLGIALHPRFSQNNLVYLYYTDANQDDGPARANRIDRFRWDGTRLVFNRAIKTMPAAPGPNHDGGKIVFGPDNQLYAVIGDVNRRERTENIQSSNKFGRHGVVLRMNASGKALRDNPFFNARNRKSRSSINEIYAYGVRNSFGIAFDPVSGVLWDTENGVNEYDEINRLPAGSNSGWADIMGPESRAQGNTQNLVKLGRKAKYVDPQLSWRNVVAPTDLEFYRHDALGNARKNDLFVGDLFGNIYNLNLTADRRNLVLSGGLLDKVIDNVAERDSVSFGEDFGLITDMVSRPDGLYVLNLDGELFRIATLGTPGPGLSADSSEMMLVARGVPEPGSLMMLGVAGALLIGRRSRGRWRGGER
jgi:glucose/arabinose dehydrogenase